MSKRKGVSAEEKRTRMLQLLYEKKDFFQLKDLEKIAPKEKGIIAQSVKDVIQSLVDDGLVDSDKIGTSTYFWAYPSKAKRARECKLEELKRRMEELNKRLKLSKEELHANEDADGDVDKKKELLSEINELRTRKRHLVSEIEKRKENDPEVLDAMKKNNEDLKEAANRWTENIFSIKKWCKSKFAIEEDALNKQFGISSELDYIP